ncbi:signal peptidase II [Paludisphaera soli]|uniref:signal peptidase II n=1 Tax=Paludisphaera soli TaxID=2712865 RepID=UPI0013EABBAA|nr:signal peptidase II [Paludisphaera soli]
MTRRVATSRWILFWALALGGAAFDLTTKAIVFDRVGPPPSAPVTLIPDVLELHTSHNPGALWGFGRDVPHSSLIFAGLSVVAGVAIVAWLFVGGAATSLPLTVALGLIMAGALGNCYDRLRFGHVRDFVHFHIDSINFDCAIFNFADNMLVAGALTLVLFALRPDPVSVEAEAAAGPAEADGAAPPSHARDAESLPTP